MPHPPKLLPCRSAVTWKTTCHKYITYYHKLDCAKEAGCICLMLDLKLVVCCASSSCQHQASPTRQCRHQHDHHHQRQPLNPASPASVATILPTLLLPHTRSATPSCTMKNQVPRANSRRCKHPSASHTHRTESLPVPPASTRHHRQARACASTATSKPCQTLLAQPYPQAMLLPHRLSANPSCACIHQALQSHQPKMQTSISPTHSPN
jgi:hypothetical protein